MRIAFFTDTYYPDINGIANEVYLMKKELERRGHDVYVLAPGDKKAKEMNEDERVIYFSTSFFKKHPNFRISLSPFVSAVERIKSLDIDVIHNHAIGTMGLAAVRCKERLKIPGITTFHHLHYFKEENIGYDIITNYLRWLYNFFEVKTTPTNYSSLFLSKIGVTSKVIPHGIDYEFFSKKRGSRRVYDFVYAGSIEKAKDLDMIIDHARNIKNIVKKDITFLMVGDGGFKSTLQELAHLKGVGDYFFWTGWVGRDRVREIFWKSKTFLFTSSYDTFPLSLLEAMACGVIPVVPEKASLEKVIIDGKNGFVWRDGMDFYRKAVESLKAKKEMRKRAQETAKEFDIKKVMDLFEREYENLKKD